MIATETIVQYYVQRAMAVRARASEKAGTSAVRSLTGLLLFPHTFGGVSASPKGAGSWCQVVQTPFFLCRGPGDGSVVTVHAARPSGGLADLPALPTGVKFSREKQ